MIVFRDQRVPADPTMLLNGIRLEVSRVTRGIPHAHDAAVRLLIDAGTLEAALDEVVFPTHDGIHSIERQLREASCNLGHVVWHTWQEQPEEARRWLGKTAAALADLEIRSLPARVQVSVPEGYAYYAVYPEMYLEAARRCRQSLGPFNAVCIGLRSIGTSLSAVVHAALEELGCKVASYTLRPRGHPFARRPVVTSELAAAFQGHAEGHAVFLIIDEGPGISGSSLAGTAELLTNLGIDEERILLFPSWVTDGAGLTSPEARGCWRRHRQFVASFEEVWLNTGRLTRTLPPGRLRDFSAGAWRNHLYDSPEAFPPIQPQHERRKYLLEPDSNREPNPSWLTFVGIEERSSEKLARAKQIACAGFTAAPGMICHGFLVRPFTPGVPLTRETRVDPELIKVMASYLAYISREQAAEPSVTHSTLTEMVTTNVAEGLGDPWLARLGSALSSAGGWCERPVALDGRMQPHEWIRTADGYLKTDAIDHCDDHFFPGRQDIAWDVAAVCLEFNLTLDEQRWLVQRYRLLSGDRTIASRLPLHALTYLAFQLGYATMAGGSLSGTMDGKRFEAAARRYQRLLQSELSHEWQRRWDA